MTGVFDIAARAVIEATLRDTIFAVDMDLRRHEVLGQRQPRENVAFVIDEIDRSRPPDGQG